MPNNKNIINSHSSSLSSDELYQKLLIIFLSPDIDDLRLFSEEEFAGQFSVGKTPVREALIRLKNEGFIISLPRKGYQIRRLSLKEIRDNFYTRIILELGAVEIALHYGDRGIYDELENMLRQSVTQNQDDSVYGYLKLNYRFHRKIIELSHNKVLLDNYQNIYNKLKRLLYLDAITHRVNSLQEEHGELVELMQSGETEKCKIALRKHLNDTWQRMVSL